MTGKCRFLLGLIVTVPMWQSSLLAQSEPFDVRQFDQYPETLMARRVAVLSTAVDGIIENIIHEPQDFVEPGDVLVQLDANRVQLEVERLQTQIDLSTTLQEAQIRLDYAVDNFDIVEKLYETKIDSVPVGSKKEYDEAKQRKDMAKLDMTKATLEMKLLRLSLRQNQKLLAMHSIYAPWNGVIVPLSSVGTLADRGLKRPEPGEMVRAGQEVIAIMKVDRLRITKALPISELDNVQLGQKVCVHVEGVEGGPIPGTVVYKSPTIVGAVKKFPIDVECRNPLLPQDNTQPGVYRYKFRPGMRARIELSDCAQGRGDEL